MAMALRLFWRDLRAGELTLLLAALILAVAATTTLRFFSSSLEQALHQQAGRLLGADLVLGSSRDIRPQWPTLAEQLQLRQSRTLEFSSVAQHGDSFQLSAIKAVSAGYPLRGELHIKPLAGTTLSSIPAPHTLWVEDRLLRLLNIQPGAELVLGEASFTISGVIDEDAELGGGFSAFAPRIIMNLADVPATKVVQPGSKLAYRLLLAGQPAAIDRFKQLAEPQLQADERLRDINSANRRFQQPLQQSTDYLNLATIAAVLLAGIAVALAAQRYSERHLDSIALMRCLGGSRRQLAQMYATQLGLLWLSAMIIGTLIGGLGSLLLLQLLASLLPVKELSLDFWHPLLTGLTTATLTLAGFALPGFIRLYQVSPLRVLRRELSPQLWSTRLLTLCAMLALALLLVAETGNLRLTVLVLGGMSAFALLLGSLCLWLLRTLPRRIANASLWRQTLNTLARQPQLTVTQVLALTLGLSAILLIITLRQDLFQQWQQDLPANTPNQFAVTIPAEQRQDLQQFLHQQHWTTTPFYPVVRGRLTAINGQDTQPQRDDEDKDGKKDESLKRELNLTWSKVLPPDNKLVAGQWLSGKADEVSVEAELAKRLKLKLGDSLRLQMAEGMVEARITSLREVDWDNFQPNFYFIFPEQALANYPATYLTSFYVPDSARSQLPALIQRFPTIIFIDLAATLAELQKLLAQLAQGLLLILLFVLVAGLLVLLASIAASLDSRRQEAALLRTLGAQRRQIQLRAGLELATLGLWAGLLSVALTELISLALHLQILDKTPHWHPWLWLTPLASMTLTLVIGLLSLRPVWTVSPLLTLKEN